MATSASGEEQQRLYGQDLSRDQYQPHLSSIPLHEYDPSSNIYLKNESKTGISPMSPDHSRYQRPGTFQKAPKIGFLALLIVLLSIAASIAVVLHANGKAIDTWPSESLPIQLSVILAIPLAVGTASLRTAFREGVTVSFWVNMRKSPKLQDVHHSWEHGMSSWSAILGLKHLNRNTIPSILMLGVVAVIPLFQRAVEIRTVASIVPATFTAPVSPNQFNQPTAYYMTHGQGVNTLSTNFSRVVQDYTDRKPINELMLQGCKGTCSGVIIAPGFDINCTREGISYNFEPQNLEASDEIQVGSISVVTGSTERPDTIYVRTTYKGKPDEKGELTATKCALHSAQVKYPFTYSNGTATMNGGSESVEGTVNRTVTLFQLDREAPGLLRAPSVLGGIAYAINQLYGSNVKLYITGLLAIEGDGPMRYTYLKSDDSSLGLANMTWNDPTPFVLEAIRELSFRTAIAFSDHDAGQTIEGYESRTTPTYRLRAVYLGVVLAILVVELFAVIALFRGFNSLHRQHTLSPLDIARGFNAPLMKGVDHYADVDEVAKSLGHHVVEYPVQDL